MCFLPLVNGPCKTQKRHHKSTSNSKSFDQYFSLKLTVPLKFFNLSGIGVVYQLYVIDMNDIHDWFCIF